MWTQWNIVFLKNKLINFTNILVNTGHQWELILMLFLYSETWPDLPPPLLSRDTVNTHVINFARGRAAPSKALSPSMLGRRRPALTPSSWTVGLDRPLSRSAAPLKIPCDLREQTCVAAKTAAKLRPGRCSPSPPGAKKNPACGKPNQRVRSSLSNRWSYQGEADEQSWQKDSHCVLE